MAWVVLNFPHISGLLAFANCSSEGFKKEVIERTEASISHFHYNIGHKETVKNIEPLLIRKTAATEIHFSGFAGIVCLQLHPGQVELQLQFELGCK